MSSQLELRGQLEAISASKKVSSLAYEKTCKMLRSARSKKSAALANLRDLHSAKPVGPRYVRLHKSEALRIATEFVDKTTGYRQVCWASAGAWDMNSKPAVLMYIYDIDCDTQEFIEEEVKVQQEIAASAGWLDDSTFRHPDLEQALEAALIRSKLSFVQDRNKWAGEVARAEAALAALHLVS
mmetsp:Transcript_2173/g.5175  ORF Transcript_2173/g.5175 Transcript_2173/m.5175 type:complete len:183 (+) Transcript_2173:40-588(+)